MTFRYHCYAETRPSTCYTKDKREVGQQPGQLYVSCNVKRYSIKDQVLQATFLQTSVFEWSPVKEKDCEAVEMKSLNSPKSHRLLDFVPSIRPSFLSVMLVFVCGCLWVKNETTNKRLIALQSRIDYLPCVKRVSFEGMTRSSTKFALKDLYKKMWTHFSEGIAHTSGKMLHE